MKVNSLPAKPIVAFVAACLILPASGRFASDLLSGRYQARPVVVTFYDQMPGPDGSIARGEYYADGSLIETRFAPPYSITWSSQNTSRYAGEPRAV
jgi:hypothetical protein